MTLGMDRGDFITTLAVDFIFFCLFKSQSEDSIMFYFFEKSA